VSMMRRQVGEVVEIFLIRDNRALAVIPSRAEAQIDLSRDARLIFSSRGQEVLALTALVVNRKSGTDFH